MGDATCCVICGIAAALSELEIYGGWCVDRDGCSKRWLATRKKVAAPADISSTT